MLITDEYDQKVAARLEEFWAWFTPWHRRLWNVGTIAALSELLEASESLPHNRLKALQDEVNRLVGPDGAIGDAATRAVLGRLLNDDLTYKRVAWHQLNQLLAVIDSGYLRRWATSVGDANRPGPERVARSVAGHLLHAGFSSTHLHRWLRYQVRHREGNQTIADLLVEADASLIQRPGQDYRVLIPVISAPDVGHSPPAEWLSGEQMADRIETIQGHRTDLRQSGGFALTVRARDHFAAVEVARELIDRWDARAELSTRNRIVRRNKAWVEGLKEAIPFTPMRRQVEIGALTRQNKVYSPLDDNEVAIRIDDALQLVQPMEAGPRSAAISGGWAAIESLLTEAQEPENLAAPRLAGIIACSFARAELTALAFSHAERGNDDLAEALREEEANLARARLVADAIMDGQVLAGSGPGDNAAVDRMKELVANPRATLLKVRDYVEIALNRLYRQRNLMLHGGRVSGDGRSQALSTAPPLVGAGLDRIVHAWFTEGTRPVELAARASLGIDLVGTASGRNVTELLEP
jgi:hypothetical protein